MTNQLAQERRGQLGRHFGDPGLTPPLLHRLPPPDRRSPGWTNTCPRTPRPLFVIRLLPSINTLMLEHVPSVIHCSFRPENPCAQIADGAASRLKRASGLSPGR